MSDEESVSDILDERPDLEEALRTIKPVDDQSDRWTFDEVSVDSGRFGELVSRGIVESTDGAYRLADPEAVRNDETVQRVAEATGGDIHTGRPGTTIRNVATDSRGTLPERSIFVALQGEHFDGHDFVGEALGSEQHRVLVEFLDVDLCDVVLDLFGPFEPGDRRDVSPRRNSGRVQGDEKPRECRQTRRDSVS
jgi:hypothetical protein